jgi:hypothetical protein
MTNTLTYWANSSVTKRKSCREYHARSIVACLLLYCVQITDLKKIAGFWEGIWLTIRPIVYILFKVYMVIGLFNFVRLVCVCVCVCVGVCVCVCVWCIVYLKTWYRIRNRGVD